MGSGAAERVQDDGALCRAREHPIVPRREDIMRAATGGTQLYCPQCKEITVCKAIPAAQVTDDSSDYRQRKYYAEHDDIQFFQRGRQCLSCYEEFVTAEIDLGFLRELIALRNALAELRRNAEAYTIESAAASSSLEKLSQSLAVLRTLNLYKEAGA
jgi:hypothetical protein